ncbi:GDSL-type esterase/lipase family protein [Pseudopedobacter beijingensis]|uniref:GDSL-type esterase/lipase family protein n=1 Tax=Pseudopedobacter beijingensis TaxID=1207056 RepID=A0ABW4I942_9SPHI
MKKRLLILLFTLAFIGSYAAENVIKIVVLGSSTAAGSGATSGQGWVSRYTAYLKNLHPHNEVVNLAVGGYTTYDIMPDNYSVPPDRRQPKTNNNITKALSYNPDVIIVNMPSNDVGNGYPTNEIMSNYTVLKSLADAQNIPIYFTSTQPRNFTDNAKRQQQVEIKNATQINYPDTYIDFWTEIAETDGRIKAEYDSSDGVHLNNAGHEILYNKVISTTSILTYAKPYIPSSYSSAGKIMIDFGTSTNSTTSTTDNYWNNITSVSSGFASPLQNQNGEITPFTIHVHAPFTNTNINGTLSGPVDYPENAIKDSFYGYTTGVFSGGSSYEKSGVTLSNLDTDKSYSLTFYASRIATASDNRETKYTVKGKTEQSVILNILNNTSNIVSVHNMEPDNNGNIIIEVTASDNNTHVNRFYYLGILDIEYKPKTVLPATGQILIDFGSSANSTISTANNHWNNINSVSSTAATPLQNKTGESTPYTINIHAPFSGTNNNGDQNGTTDYPANATKDSFYGFTTGTFGTNTRYDKSGITLNNLDTDNYYSLTFYASRIDNNASDNRETKYTIKGKTEQSVILNILNNTFGTVAVQNIEPDNEGKIIIEVTASDNNTHTNKFYYLGVLDIEYKPKTTPVTLVDYTLVKHLDYIDVNWSTLSENRNSHFEIYRAGSDHQFLLLSTIPAVTYTGFKTYNYQDNDPLTGINYYFLRQVDTDGKYKDYAPKSINFSSNTNNEFNVYVLTESEDIIVNAYEEKENKKAEISIYNSNGRLLTKKETILKKGNNQINVGKINHTGVYIAILKKENKMLSCKFLINF